MMGWIVFGIIAFVVTLWVWRHTYTAREKVYDESNNGHYLYDEEDRPPLPRWACVLIFVAYMTPVVSLFVFVAANACYWLFAAHQNDLFFHVKGNRFTNALRAFLTKDVYAKKKSE